MSAELPICSCGSIEGRHTDTCSVYASPPIIELDIDTSEIGELRAEVRRLRESESRALDFCIGLCGRGPDEVREAFKERDEFRAVLGSHIEATAKAIAERDEALEKVNVAGGWRDKLALISERDELALRESRAIARAEASEASCTQMREAIQKALPNIGAWENQCPFCLATTEFGEIPHKPDCVSLK